MSRLALFDCDGTLVDGQAAICEAIESCFSGDGRAMPPRAAIRRVVGLSLVEAMAALLPDADADEHARMAEAYKRAFQAMRERQGDAEPLFEGIVDALDALAGEGWLLGVATGKSDRGLRHCLDAHGIADRFATLQTADHHPSKPSPAMALAALADTGADAAASAMIGDTWFDMAMARAAGMRAIGVAWGYHDAGELLAEGAIAVANHARELPALLGARA